MKGTLSVKWTARSLQNAQSIIEYLDQQFSSKEVDRFKELLKQFEDLVALFPEMYPASIKQPSLRKAVIHKHTSVFYKIKENEIVIVALQGNRQGGPL